MPKKFIPYYPNTIEGQAILNNITRTKRVLKYRDSDKVYERIQRGLPLYDLELIERVCHSEEQRNEESKNLVIRGECISACAYLKQKGIKVDLVYIDPPFASGADYAKKVFIRRNPQLAEEIKKAEETLDIDELRSFEEKMYGDVWNKEDYLNWMYENISAIKSVMSPTASIFIHIDWNIGHYTKILLDEIFGEENFINEIIWYYYNKLHDSRKKILPRAHDVIFRYCLNEQEYHHYPLKERREKSVKKLKYAKVNGQIQNIIGTDGKAETYISEERTIDDVWRIRCLQPANQKEWFDYNTQKPEDLIARIFSLASQDKMLVADFFGGSGVTAKVANDLGRNFIHVDIGLNSIQTTRDRLKAAGAEFDVLEVKDGVNLFRNPIQTMDKLASLIPGLQKNKKYAPSVILSDSEESKSLSQFWFGSLSDSKLGQIPVYVPNLLDHNQKVLDIPIINEIISQELPKLENIKKVIAYYIDLSDEKTIKNFIQENNATEIEVELKDLKQILDEVVVTDQVEYSCHSEERSDEESNFTIEIHKFTSDRLIQKIDEYNQKKELSSTKTKLIEDSENGNGDSDETENGEEENGNGKLERSGNPESVSAPEKKTFKKIDISENGLELIELVSLDCTNAEGIWTSSTEVKIDKYGYVIKDGTKTKTFWDAKIHSAQKPLRMKIRNIAGDEIIVLIDDNKKNTLTKNNSKAAINKPKNKMVSSRGKKKVASKTKPKVAKKTNKSKKKR